MKSRKALKHKKRLTRTNQSLRKYKRQKGGAFGFPQLSNKNAKRTIVTFISDARDDPALITTTLEQAEEILEDTQM